MSESEVEEIVENDESSSSSDSSVRSFDFNYTPFHEFVNEIVNNVDSMMKWRMEWQCIGANSKVLHNEHAITI